MSNGLTKEKFVQSINEHDNSYQKFSNNHIPIYKEFYVENSDDAIFYKNYLGNIYNTFPLLKVYGCNGKKEVLKEYSKYTGKKAGFIVDKDYLPINKSKYEKVIITTGYSMENFFFFKIGEIYNFEPIFKMYYGNQANRKIKEYIKELSKYKETYILYFAFFKTCMEFSNCTNYFNNHLKIKDIIKNLNDFDSIEELIKQEIMSLKYHDKFYLKYLSNINELKESEYMLIRGHDIFDHLVDFIKKDGKYIKKIAVLETAKEMEIPTDFIEQITV